MKSECWIHKQPPMIWPKNLGPKQKCPECGNWPDVFEAGEKRSFEYHLKSWGKTKGKDWLIHCEGEPIEGKIDSKGETK